MPLLPFNRRTLPIQRDISNIGGLTADGSLNGLLKYT